MLDYQAAGRDGEARGASTTTAAWQAHLWPIGYGAGFLWRGGCRFKLCLALASLPGRLRDGCWELAGTCTDVMDLAYSLADTHNVPPHALGSCEDRQVLEQSYRWSINRYPLPIK